MNLSKYLESKLSPEEFDLLTRRLYAIRNRKTEAYRGTETDNRVKSIQARIDFKEPQTV